MVTGTGRRRQWRQDDKARVVIESLKRGANVSEVARRHGLSPQQLFGSRREARALMADEVEASNAPVTGQARCSTSRKPRTADALTPIDPAPAFASVVIAAPVSASPPAPPSPPASGRIEIALFDTVVRVIGQVEPATLTAVLRAVRRAT